MSNRDRIALAVPPLLLRLVLAVTFLWAGLSKALTFNSVSPQGAATLASMGVSVSNVGGLGGTPPVIVPAPSTPSGGARGAGGGAGGGAMLNHPPLGFQGAGFQTGGAGNTNGGAGSGGTTPPFPADGFSKPKQDTKPETKPDQPATTPPPAPAPAASEPEAKPKNIFSPPAPTPTPTPTPAPAATPAPSNGPVRSAEDFPNPEPVRRVYLLALTVHAAANPPAIPAGASGEAAVTKMHLLPGEMGQGSRPVYVAFTIAAVEIIAGAMLLLGMLSRVWALAVAFVMVGALWLTQFGPAMQAGNTVLGFLPNRPWGDMSQWTAMLWQLSLLASALAIVFAGSGALAVDNAMFGRRGERAEHDE